MPCRINYTSQWALRLMYELSDWSCASFITLTYDEEHLPKDGGLYPRDLSLFWKRLRKNLDGRKIRYYACGEYGEKGRPHYHAIVYGLDNYCDDDRECLIDAWYLCDPLRFDKKLKHSGMLPVCREDICYVTGYVQKKLNGDMAEAEYGDKIRPFSRCSQGLGLDFALEHKDRLINNGFTYLGKNKIAIPRYLRDKLGIKMADYIDSSTTMTVEREEREAHYLYDMFIQDMKNRGTWYPNNLTMMSIRFERWYNDMNYSLSKSIERDYLEKGKLKGRYI